MKYKIVKLHYYDNSNIFYDYLVELLKDETEKNDIIVLDLKDVMFITSCCLGLLAKYQTNFKNTDKDIILVNINDSIRKIFKITNFDQFFQIFDSIEDFEKSHKLTRENE